MANVDMTHIDLECGRHSTAAGGEEEEIGNVCFSEESNNSQLYSTTNGDGSSDDCSEILEAESLKSVDLESGTQKVENNNLINLEIDCRICHLSLINSSSGPAIELGCSCKDDLATAHTHCAETWFKIKGNNTCEICNSVASNVVVPNGDEADQQATAAAAVPPSGPMSSTTETSTCLSGQQFLNFILACMVLAFILSWLFHYDILM